VKTDNVTASRFRFQHANFHAPKGMSEKYSNVALKLGDDFKLRAFSAFRTKAMVVVAETKDAEDVMPVDVMPELTEKVEETEPGTMTTMFKSHFDTHAISGTMFSLSSKDAFVYYTKEMIV
jgi:hypothetical protein